MSHVLFGIYSLLFVVSFLGEESGHILFGAVTALAVIGWLFRNLDLLRRGGYYARKYARILVLVPIPILYLLLPYPIASVICYVFIAGWLYVIPGGRLIVLRTLYSRALKSACRKRNYGLERVDGGFVVRTPAKVYDIRLVGAFRRVGVFELTDETRYTLRQVPPYVSKHPELLRDMLAPAAGEASMMRQMIVGKVRVHTLAWSDIPADGRTVERVVAFLPGLCEWRFAEGEQDAANGSVVRGVTLYDLDVFIENRLR